MEGGHRSAADRTPGAVGEQYRNDKTRMDLGSPGRRNLGRRVSAKTRVTLQCHNSNCHPWESLDPSSAYPCFVICHHASVILWSPSCPCCNSATRAVALLCHLPPRICHPVVPLV